MQWELLLFAGIKREEMIMELKSIFLDIDNTLLDFDAAAQQSMEESFHMILSCPSAAAAAEFTFAAILRRESTS